MFDRSTASRTAAHHPPPVRPPRYSRLLAAVAARSTPFERRGGGASSGALTRQSSEPARFALLPVIARPHAPFWLRRSSSTRSPCRAPRKRRDPFRWRLQIAASRSARAPRLALALGTLQPNPASGLGLEGARAAAPPLGCCLLTSARRRKREARQSPLSSHAAEWRGQDAGVGAGRAGEPDAAAPPARRRRWRVWASGR